MIVIQIIGAIALHLVLFSFFGIAVLQIAHGKAQMNNAFILGVFVYFALFFVIAFPMKVAQLPLKVIFGIWGIICLAVVVLVIVKGRKACLACLKGWVDHIRETKVVHVLGLAILAMQLWFVELKQDVGSPWDAAYYIGEINSDLLHGYAGLVDVFTGASLPAFNYLYVFETYLMNCEFFCKLMNLPTLIEVRSVWLAVVIVIYNAILWAIATALFKVISWKHIVLLAGCFAVNLFSNVIYWPGYFLFNRGFEGKAFLANIILPALFLGFLWLLEEKPRLEGWGLFFCVSLAAGSFSMSAIFLVTPCLFVYGLILVLKNRNWKTFRNSVICIAPIVCMAGLYVLASKGIIQFLING